MAAPAHPWNQPSRRRMPRYHVQAPVDVTVLRSGIPDTIPGRSVDLCERGVAAVLAGEVVLGEAVGVELQLTHMTDPLRARAMVRHQEKLCCGMEFVGLSTTQQAAIREWAEQISTEIEPAAQIAEPEPVKEVSIDSAAPPTAPLRRWRPRWAVVAAAIVLGALASWWRWHRGWQELESTLPREGKTVVELSQTQVPAEVMEKLIVHRVDPDYPEEARKQHLEGVIVLDVIVGRDGEVEDVHPLNGPDVLSKAAADALRWWRFQPYRVDGKAVPVETTVAVEFRP